MVLPDYLRINSLAENTSFSKTWVCIQCNSSPIIGHVGERRTISLNPALMNALDIPVPAKTGRTFFSALTYTGWPSSKNAPCDLTSSLATRRNQRHQPMRLSGCKISAPQGKGRVKFQMANGRLWRFLPLIDQRCLHSLLRNHWLRMQRRYNSLFAQWLDIFFGCGWWYSVWFEMKETWLWEGLRA